MISYPLPGGLSFVGRMAQSRVPAVPKPRHLRARMPAFHSVSLPETPLPVSTGNETAHPSVSSRMLMRVAAGVGEGVRRLISLRADHIAHSPSKTFPTITHSSASSMFSPVVSQAQESTGDTNNDAKKSANANHNA